MTPEELDQVLLTAYRQGWEDARFWTNQRQPSADIQRYGETQTILVRHVGGDHRATNLLP